MPMRVLLIADSTAALVLTLSVAEAGQIGDWLELVPLGAGPEAF